MTAAVQRQKREAPKRFVCCRRHDGTWTVWDRQLDAPASLDGQQLVARPEHRAQAACSILNRIAAAQGS